jgi:RNA polymerase sigma-70 factor (ECF subfamily)
MCTARAMGGPPTRADDRDLRDEELVHRLSCGDVGALEAILDRYENLVYSTARRIVGDDHLAEDISQEVFWRLWRHSEKYVEEKGRVTTWLLSITHNRAVDELRRRRRRLRHETASPEQQERELRASDSSNPAASAELAERQGTARAALSRLSPQQRQAIELAYFRGLTQREVADRLGQPLGTIKSRIRQGMLTLREMLKVSDEADGATLTCC